jgi:LPXTG-motif cell wall-anchored protein
MHATLVGLTAFVLTASTALAQTTPTTPSPAPDVATGGIADYWWIIVVVVLVALAIWYFTRGRTRP